MDSTALSDAKHADRLAKLQAEQSQIEARRKRRKAADEADRKRLHELERLIHREKIVALVGVQSGVKVAYRQCHSHPEAFLNDARGTVTKVNRTIALVQWDTPCPRDGYQGIYQWHLEALMPAEQLQGCTFDALASGEGLEL